MVENAIILQRKVRPSLHLQELLKLSIHDFDCLMCTIDYSLQQLPSLND